MAEAVVRVSIVGASGYIGGEALRLLLDHPRVRVAQATSNSQAGKLVQGVHPNLRGRTDLKFCKVEELAECDLLLLALPHGAAQERIEHFAALAPRILDLSADFRLQDTQTYERWYGRPHACPERLAQFVYGLPETRREALRTARFVSGVGCNATASNLSLLPLVRAGLIDPAKPVVVDLKVGSSEAGNSPSATSHHPERSGTVRAFAPTRHRHAAEVEQELGLPRVELSVHSVEMVRGAVAAAHCWAPRALADKDLWQAYRGAYAEEPFVRIVHSPTGIFRHPEPKILAGSNYADVGFDHDPETGRIVSICALDNLMKGGAGTAVQCLNLMMGWDERDGLSFPGLHPL